MRIIVIGGGAAGYFSAIHAAQSGAEVLILEKSNKVLAKVKVSGGGRCNVTNACDDVALLVQNYPRGSKELRGPFTKFQTAHTREWFESRGVSLKSEADGRVFPVSDSSQSIIDCLESEAVNYNVEIKTQIQVLQIKTIENKFDLDTSAGVLIADKVIIASGGNPSLKSYTWLSDLGHSIIPPVPSLFTFNMPKSRFVDLMGVSVPSASIKIAGSNFAQEGPLLFTHWGISGPAVLKLSAWAARWLYEKNYTFSILVNFLAGMKENEAMEILLHNKNAEPGKKVISSKPFSLPVRLWEKICMICDVSDELKWAEAGKTILNKLAANVTSCSMNVSGKTTFKEEFVTCGGVDLKEVDMKTMQSKKVPGLYFAGEILNIDGVTGGFNFQAAWTTGYIAGTAVTSNSVYSFSLRMFELRKRNFR